jgi:hypothetical protein
MSKPKKFKIDDTLIIDNAVGRIISDLPQDIILLMARKLDTHVVIDEGRPPRDLQQHAYTIVSQYLYNRLRNLLIDAGWDQDE